MNKKLFLRINISKKILALWFVVWVRMGKLTCSGNRCGSEAVVPMIADRRQLTLLICHYCVWFNVRNFPLRCEIQRPVSCCLLNPSFLLIFFSLPLPVIKMPGFNL